MSRSWPAVLLVLLLMLSMGGNVLVGTAALDSYRQLWLERIGLGAYTAPAQAPVPVDILYLGDSRIAGWTSLPTVDGLTTANAGVGGQTSAMLLGRLDGHILAHTPRVVVLQVGINDLKVIGMVPERADEIFAACEANMRSIVASITASGAGVLLLTVIPAGESLVRRTVLWSDRVDLAIVELNERLLALGSESVVVVDCARALASDGRLSTAHSDGFLHLNAGGYEQLSKSIRGPLEGLIGR
ncbi:MAG: lysophospholipase L1-like esterase [Chlamydiales bacterium]|jgi:lysophospholipase L1-like esterase